MAGSERRRQVAIVGAGWAGLAAAVAATDAGHRVTLFEAARQLGGRARTLPQALADGHRLDNGQHILIGAYQATLGLMRRVGLDPGALLQALPLTLTFPDGGGLQLPAWPAPWDALAGVLRARGWGAADKLGLLRHLLGWRLQGFRCDAQASVADLCTGMPARIRDELIEPLCVSALNTPLAQASATVFLRVLHDALLGPPGSSHLLLPRTDLGALLPDAAAAWLAQRGAVIRPATRVAALARDGSGWRVDSERFDAVLLACPPRDAAMLLRGATVPTPERPALDTWAGVAEALRFEAIATVYAHAAPARLAQPLLALRSGADAPAQFVFDRGQLGGPPGLLAFVASCPPAIGRSALQDLVLAQGRQQLGLTLAPLRTVTEKRATFACTPGLQRPGTVIADGLWACGDAIAGPYPATLEGAVRSGLAAAAALAPV